MFLSKNIIKNIIIISLIINIISCQKLSKDLLRRWGEIKIKNQSSIFSKVFEAAEKYFVSEGYSLDETDILPFGFFKQTLNGINYRLLCAVKKNLVILQLFMIYFYINLIMILKLFQQKNLIILQVIICLIKIKIKWKIQFLILF